MKRAEREASGADQLAADQHAPDLVGAGADVEQLGVAQVALHRPVLGVARAAQRLDRLAGAGAEREEGPDRPESERDEDSEEGEAAY